jgi:hypothetical protein
VFLAVWQFLKLPAGEGQRRAADRVVHALAELNRPLLLRWLLWRRRDVLFNDDAAWGRVGYALTRFGRAQAMVDWFANWPQRAETQPWMHFNHCLMLRQLGRYPEADEVARTILETRGHQPGAEDFRLFLAMEAALAGDAEAASAHLQHVPVRHDNRYDTQMLALAQMLTKFHLLPEEALSERLPGLLEELGKKLGQRFPLGAMRDVRRTFRRVGRAVAAAGGGWQVHAWFLWKTAWLWLIPPGLLAGVALMIALITGPDGTVRPYSGVPFLGLWIVVFLLRAFRNRAS